ncbi:hypothetical protein RR42_s0059 [Cupriavidus basilensis]|uniref:Uncharacterized protein n=1 Tax=Cupriavidus basilensis TaxID=68895 RepID=A0A0C4Y8E0_9BURK|nr:hypothetical protein RR42_s0059 [Cupriavidus basilensis]
MRATDRRATSKLPQSKAIRQIAVAKAAREGSLGKYRARTRRGLAALRPPSLGVTTGPSCPSG